MPAALVPPRPAPRVSPIDVPRTLATFDAAWQLLALLRVSDQPASNYSDLIDVVLGELEVAGSDLRAQAKGGA